MSDSIKYTIYSQAGFDCLWCKRAADLLDDVGEAYSLRPLSKTDLSEKARQANMLTIPIIYHGVRLVGGYEELVDYVKK